MSQPSLEEIDNVSDWALQGINEGTRFPGMSYEDGVQATIEWMRGDTDERPDDD